MMDSIDFENILKSKEELNKITNECYEICNGSWNKDCGRDFFEFVDDYLLNSYPELTFSEKNLICDTIEDIIDGEQNKSNEKRFVVEIYIRPYAKEPYKYMEKKFSIKLDEPKETYGVKDNKSTSVIECTNEEDAEILCNLLNELPDKYLIEYFG